MYEIKSGLKILLWSVTWGIILTMALLVGLLAWLFT